MTKIKRKIKLRRLSQVVTRNNEESKEEDKSWRRKEDTNQSETTEKSPKTTFKDSKA